MDNYIKKWRVSAIIGIVGAIVGTIALKSCRSVNAKIKEIIFFSFRTSRRLYADDEYTTGLREAIGQNIHAQSLYYYETIESDPGVSVPA
ncbi:unnamed protein product, partial [Rotaria sp. Silwood2]